MGIFQDLEVGAFRPRVQSDRGATAMEASHLVKVIAVVVTAHWYAVTNGSCRVSNLVGGGTNATVANKGVTSSNLGYVLAEI